MKQYILSLAAMAAGTLSASANNTTPASTDSVAVATEQTAHEHKAEPRMK